MDRFFDQANIERYRQLASASTKNAERKFLLTLLAAEIAEFKRGPRSRAISRPEGSQINRVEYKVGPDKARKQKPLINFNRSVSLGIGAFNESITTP
jgi:hypothetical protein